MVAARVEAAAHAPAERFSIMPILNRKKKRCEELKVILLGDAGVGKTSLVAALAQRGASRDPTGVDFHVKMATLNNEIVKVQLWDTADQEQFGFNALPKSYFRRTRGVFLMYDVASRQSFRNVVQWALQLQALASNGDALGLVLIAKQNNNHKCSDAVSSAEGRALAAMLQCRFVSYASADSAECCFDALIDELSTQKPWEATLSNAVARLAAIEAEAEMAKETVAEVSETESEDEGVLGFDSDDSVATQSVNSSRNGTPSESLSPVKTSGVTRFAVSTHRRASHFFTTLELGLVSPKTTGIAGLPTARELARATLMLVFMLLLLWPFTLMLLLQDETLEPSKWTNPSRLAGLVKRLVRSSSDP